MNGRLVMYQGKIWKVEQPGGGGVCLKRQGGFCWISTSELAVLESAGLEGLRGKGRMLVRVDA